MNDKPLALICYQGDYYNNLGDDIQALSALQYLKQVDHYIPIDEIGAFKRDDSSQNLKVKAILNGWYTSNPDSWPPSEDLTPLFISFHVADEVYPGYPNPGPNVHRPPVDVLLSPLFKDYFKTHEPIGCRDLSTMERMKEVGIDSYLSGCLTLTLGSQGAERKDHICLVDVACDTNTLLKGVPSGLLKNIRLMTHTLPNAGSYTIKQRLKMADDVLKIYQTAALVVTSRLHCALPCLAFGTPVIFVLPQRGLSRLPGLLELLHYCSTDDLQRSRFQIPWRDPSPNPVSISNLAEDLRRRCASFFGGGV